MNNTINSNATSCNVFNPEYCIYRLPCGTCMMLKSACPHITNKLPDSNFEKYKLPDTITAPSWTSDIPPSCKNCPNHPSNGGSGICNCTLGDYKVTC